MPRKSPVSGLAGSVRIQRLSGPALAAAEAHGKRLDNNGKARAIYDAPPVTSTGLDLGALYETHIAGDVQAGTERAKTHKSSTKALHMILQFPAHLVDGEAGELLLHHAEQFSRSVFGNEAIFANRVDRDEKSRHVVDLFLAPKYLKQTKRSTSYAVSTSKHLKELAKKYGKAPTLRGQGQALQDAWFEYLRDHMGLSVQRGAAKARPGDDWQTPEELEAERVSERFEDILSNSLSPEPYPSLRPPTPEEEVFQKRVQLALDEAKKKAAENAHREYVEARDKALKAEEAARKKQQEAERLKVMAENLIEQYDAMVREQEAIRAEARREALRTLREEQRNIDVALRTGAALVASPRLALPGDETFRRVSELAGYRGNIQGWAGMEKAIRPLFPRQTHPQALRLDADEAKEFLTAQYRNGRPEWRRETALLDNDELTLEQKRRFASEDFTKIMEAHAEPWEKVYEHSRLLARADYPTEQFPLFIQKFGECQDQGLLVEQVFEAADQSFRRSGYSRGSSALDEAGMTTFAAIFYAVGVYLVDQVNSYLQKTGENLKNFLEVSRVHRGLKKELGLDIDHRGGPSM